MCDNLAITGSHHQQMIPALRVIRLGFSREAVAQVPRS